MARKLTEEERQARREAREQAQREAIQEAAERFAREAPPLTPEQVQTIANLLRPYSSALPVPAHVQRDGVATQQRHDDDQRPGRHQ